MKAIILERRGDLAAVLCEDGTFANRRVSGEVGETVELAAETIVLTTKRRSRWLRSAVAAMLVLAVTGGTLGYMGGTASAYVSLDVEDSSIELTVNHFGRVIAVNALTEDAEELAESLSGEVRHRRAEDALDITITRLHDKGYFDGADGTVIAGVATDDGKRSAELRRFVERSVERAGESTACVSETSRAEREQARERQISIGQFGFERDRGKIPSAADPEKETPRSSQVDPSMPAIPANGTENNAPAERQEPPAEQSEQEKPKGETREQLTLAQEEPPTQNNEQPSFEQPQPPLYGDQHGFELPQPPQSGEQPEQGQLPQDSDNHNFEHELPQQGGEQLTSGQELPPQGGNQSDHGKEQPPQGEGPISANPSREPGRQFYSFGQPEYAAGASLDMQDRQLEPRMPLDAPRG